MRIISMGIAVFLDAVQESFPEGFVNFCEGALASII